MWSSNASEQTSESCGCDAVIEEIEKEAMDIVPGLETKCAAAALLRTHREFLSEVRASSPLDRSLRSRTRRDGYAGRVSSQRFGP